MMIITTNAAAIERLVELGADKLESMFESLKLKDQEAAHYYKGGFQALKEAAHDIFDMDTDGYRADCITVVNFRQAGALESGEVSGDE